MQTFPNSHVAIEIDTRLTIPQYLLAIGILLKYLFARCEMSINDFDVGDVGHGKILEDFTSKASSSDDNDRGG